MKKRFRSLLALLAALALLVSALPAAVSAEHPPGEEVRPESKTSIIPADPVVPEPEIRLPEMKRSEDGSYVWMEHVGGTSVTDAYLAAQAAGTAQPQDDLPAYYNSKDKGWVTPVRNQNPYGSCWAHAPLASIESYMIKHGIVNGATGSAANTGINLSETHLAWYAYTDAYDKLGMLMPDTTVPYDNYMDNGGNEYYAAYTLMRGEGPASETVSALAYQNVPTGGLGDGYALDYNVTQVRDVEWIPASNRDAVKRAIMEYGAGAISYYHDDAYFNYNNGAYCCKSETVVNHAVTVVGWNDDYAVSNFNSRCQPSNPGAWIIKNSWGTGIGDSGYIYISYEDTSCNASDCFFFRVDSGEDFDRIYQYDGTTCTGYFNWFSGFPLATVFRSGDDRYEELKSAAICVWDEGVSYNLKIYTDLTDEADPTSGTLALEQNGSFVHAGYHQIRLDSTVVLRQHRLYSLVFTLTGSKITVPVDYSATIDNHVTWVHDYRENTSFRWNGASWNSAPSNSNFRMKAYTSQHEHEIVETEVEPTCTEWGCKTDTCWCGYEFSFYLPPLGHDYSIFLEHTEPTCTRPGGDRYMCFRCGDDNHWENEVPAFGHNYQSVITPPTCTEEGYTTYTCSRCGDSYVGDQKDSLGHDYHGESSRPTCTEEGYTLYTCSRCGDIDYVWEAPPLGHSYVSVEIPGTCMEEGYTHYTCTRCGDTYNDNFKFGPHNYAVSIQEPGCTTPGARNYTCVICGESYSEEIPPHGHDYRAAVTAPTCTEQGYTEYCCSICADSYTADYTAPLGHDYRAAVTAPTCTGGGFTTYTCKRCRDSYVSDPVPANGHNFVRGVCTVCGAIDPDYEPPQDNPFVDVQEGRFYYEAVLWAFYHDPQVTNGTDDTHFSPNKVCTRGQVVTFLWRALGCPEATQTTHSFTDVKPSAYYYKAMLWAVENGITSGTSATTFSPNKEATRAQVVTFIWRAMDCPEPESTICPFTDVKASSGYYKAILWAVENEITSGTSATTFSPNKTCNRGQVVTFLHRAVFNMELE